MHGETRKGELAGMQSGRVAGAHLGREIPMDPRAIRVCCGHTIEPYLAEMQDPSGSSLFVSVWGCPHCGRTTC